MLKTQLNVTLPEFKTPDMLANLTIFGLSSNKTERLGVRLRRQGFRPKHPIVIVPGEGKFHFHGNSISVEFPFPWNSISITISISISIWQGRRMHMLCA